MMASMAFLSLISRSFRRILSSPFYVWPSGNGAQSMGHQNRHGHMLENMARHISRRQRPEARVGNGAHDQQVVPLVGDAVQQGIADGDLLNDDMFRLRR